MSACAVREERSENRREKKWRGDQRHPAPPSVSLLCGESGTEQQGDYRLTVYTRRNSAAAIHHGSIFSSFLPLQPINTVKQCYLCWGKKKRRQGERWKSDRHWRKKEKANHVERGAELFSSVAMVTLCRELSRTDSCHSTAGYRG